MSSVTMYIMAMVGIVLMVLGYAFRGDVRYALSYFTTEDGKGILKGIVLALVFGLVVSMVSSVVMAEGGHRWFQYGEVFTGLDRTKKVSPQCEGGGLDDRTTSNLGIRANIFEHRDGRFHLNGKYTHHSCALNPDTLGYDALGVELIYRIW